jgi:hypothetical protein
MEQYYDATLPMFEWTRQYLLANMRVVYECAKRLVKDNQDYEARAVLL